MSEVLTPTQADRIDARVKRSVYLCAVEHAGVEELLSSTEEVTFNGDVYAASSFKLGGITDTRSATISLPWSLSRLAEVQSGAYRNGRCRIWVIPVDPDAENLVFVESDAVLLMDGLIRSSSFRNNAVVLQISHKNSGNIFSPRQRVGEITSFALPVGTTTVWEGSSAQLESRISGSDASFLAALVRAKAGGSVASGRELLLSQTRGRLSGSQLKELSTPPRDQVITVAGVDAPIPIVYGRRSVPGLYTFQGLLSGDLVVGVVWCYGEIEEVESVYISGAAVPAGVTVTHYLGTTAQTVDATLTAAIPAFNDDLIVRTAAGDVGVAYSVFRIPVGELSAPPTFQAILKGRKVYDPRNETTAYSTNTALAFNDLASNPVFGLGVSTAGIVEAADNCDELIEGSKRSEIGIQFTQVRKTEEYLDLLATYGEFIWYNEGADIAVVPDKAITAESASGENAINGLFADQQSYFAENYSAEGYSVAPVSVWALGDGWLAYDSALVSDGSQLAESEATQDIELEEGSTYAFRLKLEEVTDGSVGVELVGDVDTIVFDPQEADADLYVLLVAPSGVTSIRVTASSDFVGRVTALSAKQLYYTEKNCLKDTLVVEGLDEGDSPSRVTVNYTDTSGSFGVWRTDNVSVQLPGVETGDVPLVSTTLEMPGVFRISEAANKANARLQRYRNRVRVSWQTTSKGLRYRKGQVILNKMPHRGTDLLVRLDRVDVIGHNRYAVSGLRYDASQYPTEIPLPEDTGVVPIGAIVLNSGESIPVGWASFDDANGRYIVGAGDTYDPGDTGGAASFSGFSGNTDTKDMHSFGGGGFFNVKQGVEGTNQGVPIVTGSAPDTLHNHSYSIGTVTPDLQRRENKLIIKTGSISTTFPASAQVFGLSNLLLQGLSRVVSSANRLLMAASANANAGLATQSVSSGTSSAGPSHGHLNVAAVREEGLGFTQTVNDSIAQGPHTHSFTASLNRDVKRLALALYGSEQSYSVIPGMIVLWSGSLASLPADWKLCNGANGTPDLTDKFVEIAPEGGENVSAGDNTVSFSATTTAHYHSHAGAASTLNTPIFSAAHTAIGHNHSVANSVSWTPPFYALAAIMYSP